jgi:DNA-binding MarR family transcriptional regulator
MVELDDRERELCMAVRTTCAAGRLRRAARVMTQRYDEALVPSGLKVTQLPILVALGLYGPLPLKRLAEALGLDRTTLTRNLRVLEQPGLIDITHDEIDARIRLASITEEGRRRLGQALELWQGVQDEVLDEFGGPRLRSLYGELSVLTEAAAGA